jgi:membrane peptidoglycan carboxypeptidase
MAESTPTPNDKPTSSGWRKPQEAPPAAEPAAAAAKATGAWRVPTLPTNLPVAPTERGTWHRPQPEDTPFTEKDETEVTPERQEVLASRPEDFLVNFTATQETPVAAAAAPAAPLRPEDSLPGSETIDAIQETPAAETDSSLLDLELGDLAAATGADADDDDDGFSMSELMALSSLVEKRPPPSIVPKATEPDDQATGGATGITPGGTGSQTLSQTGPEDPAAYARRQLELLTGVKPGTGATPAVVDPVQSASDPAAYARQQLENLGTGAIGAAVGGAAAITPQQEQLAQKFRDTEVQVRSLRQQLQSGQINQQQMADQLKRLMILDENNVWWMLGAETDTWYRYANNQWLVDSPPYYTPSVTPRTPTPTETSQFNPSDIIHGSLPVLPSSEALGATQVSSVYDTSGFGITEELGLPKGNVPINDPNRTVVSTVGAYLPPVRPDSAQTLPNVGGFGSEPTVLNQPAVGYDANTFQPATPAPIPADAYTSAPDYTLDKPAPTYEDIAVQSRGRTLSNLLKVLAAVVALSLLGVACGIVTLVILPYNNLVSEYQPQIAALANYQPQFQTARILDMDGNVIAELNSQDGGARTKVPYSRISPFMIHAVVSLENERFFEDPGWDWIAISRAVIQNFEAGEIESGASTITQQIAEQLILRQPTTTPELKMREIVIASQIAQQYTKQQILEIYLNEIFFGNQSYGVESAARFYFGVSANDLNLPQAAMLAGMIASPVQYNPVRLTSDTDQTYGQRRDGTFERMEVVIQRMIATNCLTFETGAQPFCVDSGIVRQARVQNAQLRATTYNPRDFQYRYPHFVQFVVQQVENLYGSGEMYRRGFVIRTTLDPQIQDAAETAIDQTMAQLINTGVTTGSVMVTDPRTGAIRAMIGSPDFNNETIDGQVNGALTPQQPGSAIKPIIYTAALEGMDDNGDGRSDRWFTPASILWDVPTTFDGNYTPLNFDRQFRGPIAVRYALQNSYNIPAIKAYQFIGEAKFREMATRLGIVFPEGVQFSLASGLGATEVTLYGMMQAYGTLANRGIRVPSYTIENITDADGNAVTLPQRAQAAQVIQPQLAYLMENILSDDVARASAFGTNGPLMIQGLPNSNYVGAKTGTTNDSRDLWTMGFTENAVVGVWLGRPDNGPTQVRDGGYGSAAPLWNRVMVTALQNMGRPNAFTNPPGLVQIQICGDTGTLPPANCSVQRTELFIQGQEPPPADQAFVQTVNVDTWTGLRADPQYCPDNQQTVSVLNITDQAAIAWLQGPGAAIAQRLGITGNTLPSVPSETCSINTELPIGRILSPLEGSTLSGTVQVSGVASAAQTFNRYQLEYAPAQNPNNFTLIGGPLTTPQPSGLLGQWDTTALPNGTYILRLAMFSNTGGFLYRTVNVNLQNIVPTATPTFMPVFQPTPGVIIDGSSQGSFITTTPAPLPFEPVVTFSP